MTTDDDDLRLAAPPAHVWEAAYSAWGRLAGYSPMERVRAAVNAAIREQVADKIVAELRAESASEDALRVWAIHGDSSRFDQEDARALWSMLNRERNGRREAQAEADGARHALARAMDYDGEEVTTLLGAVAEAGRMLRYERKERADLERQVADLEQHLTSKSITEDAVRGDLQYEMARTSRLEAAIRRAVADLARSDVGPVYIRDALLRVLGEGQ